MKIRLVMNNNYVVPGAEYVVEVNKVDKHGYHGTYKLIDDKAKYGHGLFKWEDILRMEKL